MSREYKIIVMGSGGVGKSALTVRFIHDMFIEKYDPTIEDSYRIMLELDDTIYNIEILDTAGTEQFLCMRDLYIKDADGFILVYSVIDISSMNELYIINNQINRVRDNLDIPRIIAGNKCDIKNDRCVSLNDGILFATKLSSEHMEISAKNSYNIKELFHSLIRKMNRYYSASSSNNDVSKSRCSCI